MRYLDLTLAAYVDDPVTIRYNPRDLALPTPGCPCRHPRLRPRPRPSLAAATGLSCALEDLARDPDEWIRREPGCPDVELLIVDEADRLKTTCLEQLRDFYDRHDLGLILIGMPGLEKRLARYPQLFSRIGFAHRYQPLSGDELTFVLTHHWQQLGLTPSATDFADAEAIAAVARITGGNFRLVQRLFSQVARVLEINGLQVITREVVQAGQPRPCPRHHLMTARRA